MSEKNLHNMLNKINILYEEYVKTHEYFLSKSMYLRYAFPLIRKISPVDYTLLLKNLDIVLKHLKPCIQALKKNSEAFKTENQNDYNTILTYSTTLFKAIWLLREMQYKLHLNKQGKAEYNMSDYRYDINRYKLLVKEYFSIGESYNKELEK